MNDLLAFGWRPQEYSTSPGLDFLGLAGPIERILDAWTPGLTNATRRARYFSLMPWIIWRYAKLGGKGSIKDQRRFITAVETFFAYVNAVHAHDEEIKFTGTIRSNFSSKILKTNSVMLPLRNKRVPASPSALDAAAYGSSLKGLSLIGSLNGFYTCTEYGQQLAKAFDEIAVSLPKSNDVLKNDEIDRSIVNKWSNLTNLNAISLHERRLLRALLFEEGAFQQDIISNRVYSLTYLLWILHNSDAYLEPMEIEALMMAGSPSTNDAVTLPKCLVAVSMRWRTIVILKHLRHASELAFKALHRYIDVKPAKYSRIRDAIESLISESKEKSGNRKLSSAIKKYTTETFPPAWMPDTDNPLDYLNCAVQQLAWSYCRMTDPAGETIMKETLSNVGYENDAAYRSYREQIAEFHHQPVEPLLRWLLIDRGLARHNKVAASKLSQHDTYRMYEDEGGPRVVGKCPIPMIQIRTGAMIRLMADLRLIINTEGKFSITKFGSSFLERQLKRL